MYRQNFINFVISKVLFWGQSCKTFYGHNLQIFVISLVYFVPGKLFQSSLMFVGEAKGALLVNYDRKKFYWIGPWITNFVRMFFLDFLRKCSR